MTMTMTTTAIADTFDEDIPNSAAIQDRRLALTEVHLRAGQLVAELSTSPAWAEADPITCRLIAEAEAVAAVTTVAVDAPAVVRCRELAAAQRRMLAALEANEAVAVDETAVVRARALLAELVELDAGRRATLRR